MAVSYAQTLSTDMVIAEAEALLDWQNDVLRQCLFPAAQKHKATHIAPQSLLNWCAKEVERNTIDKKVAERYTLVFEEVCRVSQKVLKHCADGNPLTVELYDAFETQCEAMLTQIRRLQQDLADSSVAVDALTGLRTVAGMRNDIKREQDRYDRKGTSFSVSAIQIDSIDELYKKHDRRAIDAVFAHVARVIARTIRSFDDAYYLGKGEFMLVLKHCEFMDACSVMDRLRREIEATPAQAADGTNINVTAAFGIAEAMLREGADLTIEHAKSALLDAQNSGGNRVAEYRELSALAQYARDMNKGSK